jgi:hypothetical protein
MDIVLWQKSKISYANKKLHGPFICSHKDNEINKIKVKAKLNWRYVGNCLHWMKDVNDLWSNALSWLLIQPSPDDIYALSIFLCSLNHFRFRYDFSHTYFKMPPETHEDNGWKFNDIVKYQYIGESLLIIKPLPHLPSFAIPPCLSDWSNTFMLCNKKGWRNVYVNICL